MTKDEFERAYAKRSHVTVERLREFKVSFPCSCGDSACEGWQSISKTYAAEYPEEFEALSGMPESSSAKPEADG